MNSEIVRAVLSYRPESGLLIWLVRASRNTHIGDVAGTLNDDGYIRIRFDGRRYAAHRLAWLHFHGAWPDEVIDHIDGKRDNNRMSNLRDVSRSMNRQNMRLANGATESGLLGVSRSGNKWRSEIGVGGTNKFLGCFSSPELAHAAYVAAKRIHHQGGML